MRYYWIVINGRAYIQQEYPGCVAHAIDLFCEYAHIKCHHLIFHEDRIEVFDISQKTMLTIRFSRTIIPPQAISFPLIDSISQTGV